MVPPALVITSKKALSGGYGGKAAGEFHITEHVDQRGPLRHQRNDGLRLDRAVFQGIDDFLLHFNLGAAVGMDLARIGNRDIAVHVHFLIGDRDEVAGPDAGLGWNEQPARGRFEDGDADNISDAKPNGLRRPMIGE